MGEQLNKLWDIYDKLLSSKKEWATGIHST